MKIEDPSALLVQWFHHKTHVLPERRRVFMAKLYQLCCPKCNNKTGFNRYGKDKAGNQKYQCKKCGHRILQRDNRGVLGRRGILCVLFAERHCMCITIGRITSTTLAQTRSAATLFLYQSLLLSQLRPCPSSLERQILSGCAIRSMRSSWP